jgi:phosphoribosyl 1,2-cyclic phosphate phosphodiesterase
MAKAILLGTGTSTGVPIIGKVYPSEYLADPRNHRTRCALLLEGPQGNVLVDAGPDIRCQLLRHQVMSIEACLITHTHADHVMGLDDLRSFCQQTGLPVRIITSPQYQQDIRRIFPYAFMDFPPGIMVPRFELEEPGDRISLAGLEIEVIWVEHGPHPVMAIRVGGFAYVTDVSHIPEKAWSRLLGLDVLVLDAVRIKPHPNHFHLAAALETISQLAPRTAYLTHLSDDFDHSSDEELMPPGVKLAYDGLSLDIAL